MADEGIGVAGHGEGLDDLVVVPARCCKVLGGPGFGVLHTLGQNLINGGGDAVHLCGDGVAIVEDRLAGRAAAGEPAENQSWEHEDKQHGQKKDDNRGHQKLFSVFSRCQCQTCRRSIGPAHRRAFGSGGNGLAGFNSAVYGMGGAGGLFQTAFLPLRHRRHGKYG